MQEIWKNVIEYETKYEISNYGNLRKLPKKSGKTYKAIHINRLGYLYTSMSNNNKKKNKTIHQLVAAAFIPNFKYGMIINHKDGNKLNNHVSNLEVCDHTYNNTHAHSLGLMPKPGKSKYNNVSIRYDKRNKIIKPIYVASIRINSKKHYIGSFKDEIEAAKAVDNYLDLIGDSIRKRNFP